MSLEKSDLDQKDYERFKKFLSTTSGIMLSDNKKYLIESRLSKILREEGIDNLGNLVDLVSKHGTSRLKDKVIDAMTTNETFWFRDAYSFDAIAKVLLPELKHKYTKLDNIRIWSAACASGQEPYSISMCIDEYLAKSGVVNRVDMIEIVASDISSTMISFAKKAEYNKMSLSRGLVSTHKQKYFRPTGVDCMLVDPIITKRVNFRLLNLLNSYGSLGMFDIIFCRNVLIYFSEEMRNNIVQRLANSLNTNGVLFLGGTETLEHSNPYFVAEKYGAGTFYRKKY